MNLQEAIPLILSAINNRSRTTSAFIWIKNVLHQIQSLGRLDFYYKEQQIDYAEQLDLPDDCDEIKEPIFLDSGKASVGTSWTDLTSNWNYDVSHRLKLQAGNYVILKDRIVFPSDTYSGVIMLPYYGKVNIPDSIDSTDEIDLPAELSYDLLVYGSAIHGLFLEDDYDRLKFAQAQYANAIERLIAKDARGKVANMTTRMNGGSEGRVNTSPFPSNYCEEL